MRLVAVLGYSERHGTTLHPICATRLAHAEGLAKDADAIVLSGWARQGAVSGEAELMHAAWQGPEAQIVLDTNARNTAGNAAAIARIARELGADEVVLVTSRWHARRARLLARAGLRGTGIAVSTSSPDDSPPMRHRVRELAALLWAPVQAVRLKSG
jgi:uncharacterized SAM-binding protein YcdF (DUF218 family)